MKQRIDVILPAGGRLDDAFARKAKTDVKALIEFRGQPLIEHTFEAIRHCAMIRRTILVGPQELLTHPACKAVDAALPDAGSAPQNLFRALEWLSNECGGVSPPRILILATDLPFLTSNAIEGFLNACPCDADVCVPVISRDEIRKRFPGAPGKFVPLRDGWWTIGSAILINPAMLVSHREAVERIFHARKRALRMAALLGLPFLVRFLTYRLKIDDVVSHCEQLLDCKGAAVRHCAPELALDIDRPAEYSVITSISQW